MANSAATRLWACLPGLWLVAGAAVADVYTWVDARGNVNVSNLTPPAGSRVTAVAHENPAAIARAEAARMAAHAAEVLALSDRVAELERAAAQPFRAPPPPFYAPLPPAPPVAPQPQYTISTSPPAGEEAPSTYGCAWVGCPLLLGPALYGAPIIIASNPLNRRGRGGHRPHGGMPAPMPHQAVGTPVPHQVVATPSPPRGGRRG